MPFTSPPDPLRCEGMASVERIVGYDCDWPGCGEGAIAHRRLVIGPEKGRLPQPRLVDLCPEHAGTFDTLRHHFTDVGRAV